MSFDTIGRIFLASALALVPISQVVAQQSVQSTTPPVSNYQPVPSELELAKLIWSTLAAIDHANLSGNYSVLRDISSPAFQIANDPSRLGLIFSGIRESRLDLANTLLLAPTYAEAPKILAENVLQVRGYFGLRPTAIAFDLQFQWSQGKWRLFGVSITPATISSSAPIPAPQPATKSR